MSEALDEAARTEALDNAPGREHFIYAITFLPTGKRYIGQTVNIRQRIYTHRSNLRTGKHWCADLQTDWNNSGKEFFSFSILEASLFSDKAANLAEAKYIFASSCYNFFITTDPTTGKLTPISTLRQSHSEKLKKAWRDPTSNLRTPETSRWDDPTQKEIQSRAMKARYSDPEERKRTSERSKAGWTEEAKKNMSARIKALWADPNSKQHTAIRGQITPKGLQAKRDKMASHWSNPAYKANHSAKIKAAWARRKAISAPD